MAQNQTKTSSAMCSGEVNGNLLKPAANCLYGRALSHCVGLDKHKWAEYFLTFMTATESLAQLICNGCT